MSHNEAKTMVFEPSPEVKAFIFQQIQDLEPMLENFGSLGVFIEKTESQLENKNRCLRWIAEATPSCHC